MDTMQSTLESRRPEAEAKSPAPAGQNVPGEGLLSRWVPAENPGKPRKSNTYHPVILKLELLSQGLKVSAEAKAQIGKTLKLDHAVGAVGKHALDIILDPGKVYVGVPVGTAVSEHLGDLTSYLAGKQLGPVLAFAEKRVPDYPAVPTVKEFNYNINITHFRAFAVKKATDASQYNALVSAMNAASQSIDYKKLLADEAAVPDSYIGGQAAQAYVQKWVEELRDLIAKSNVKDGG